MNIISGAETELLSDQVVNLHVLPKEEPQPRGQSNVVWRQTIKTIVEAAGQHTFRLSIIFKTSPAQIREWAAREVMRLAEQLCREASGKAILISNLRAVATRIEGASKAAFHPTLKPASDATPRPENSPL